LSPYRALAGALNFCNASQATAGRQLPIVSVATFVSESRSRLSLGVAENRANAGP
jgi:hypothetical protein